MVNLPANFKGVVVVIALVPHAGYVRGDVIDYFPHTQTFSPEVYNNPNWSVHYVEGGTMLEGEALLKPELQPDMIMVKRRRSIRLDLNNPLIPLNQPIWTVANLRQAIYHYPVTVPAQPTPTVVA